MDTSYITYKPTPGLKQIISTNKTVLRRIIIGADVASSEIIIYDNRLGDDSNPKLSFAGDALMSNNKGEIEINAEFENGITVDMVNQTNVTFVWDSNSSNGWNTVAKIVIDHTKVSADLTGFPVYVDLSHMGSAFFNEVKPDGGDIRVFQSDNSTRVPVEIVSIDKATQTGQMWFKGDLSSTVDTTFYVWYGNAGATMPARTETYGSDNVWGNYQGVYHLNSVLHDSSPSNRTLTKTANATLTTDRFGDTDKAYALDSADIENKIRVNSSPDIGELGDVTYSTLISPTSATVNNAYIYSHYNWNFLNTNGSGGSKFNTGRMNNSSGPFYEVLSNTNMVVGQWYRLKAVYHPDPTGGNGYIKYYINGVLQGTTSIGSNIIWADYGNVDIQFGNANHGAAVPFQGKVDESDVYTGVQSPEWITTDTNNIMFPSTFYSILN